MGPYTNMIERIRTNHNLADGDDVEAFVDNLVREVEALREIAAEDQSRAGRDSILLVLCLGIFRGEMGGKDVAERIQSLR